MDINLICSRMVIAITYISKDFFYIIPIWYKTEKRVWFWCFLMAMPHFPNMISIMLLRSSVLMDFHTEYQNPILCPRVRKFQSPHLLRYPNFVKYLILINGLFILYTIFNVKTCWVPRVSVQALSQVYVLYGHKKK